MNYFLATKKETRKPLFVSQYQEYTILPELSSPAQSWETNLEKSQKSQKCYYLSLANLGDQSSTRALQSSPLQISGG